MVLYLGRGTPYNALNLLDAEPQGFAIDASQEGGTVAVKDTTTPSNNLKNVTLDGSNLIQGGSSPKLVAWNDGKLRWNTHNFLKQSQSFNVASWLTTDGTLTGDSTTAPDGTLTAEKYIPPATTDSHGFYYGDASLPVTVASTNYTVSVYLKAGGTLTYATVVGMEIADSTRFFACTVNLLSGVITQTGAGAGGIYASSSITSIGSGWYRVTLTGQHTGVTIQPYFHGSSSGTPTYGTNGDTDFASAGTDIFYAWGAQLNRGPIALPYLATTTTVRIGIPQEYDVSTGKFAILSEPAATNLVLRNQEFNNVSWGKDGASVTADSTTAPDGSSTADTITEDGSNNRHIAYQQVTLALGAWVASVFVKRKDRQWASIAIVSGNGADSYTVNVDLTNGNVTTTASAGSGTALSNSVTSIGNGWYRVVLTQTSTQSNPFIQVGLSNSATPSYSGGNALYVGDSVSGMYVWGAQLETGTVATSYIPTVASTVARGADAVYALVGTMSVTQAASYSMYVKAKSGIDGTTTMALVGFQVTGSPGWTSNSVAIGVGAQVFTDLYYIGAGQTSQPAFGTPTLGVTFKAAARFATNDYNGAFNGVLPFTADTSCSIPTTIGLNYCMIGCIIDYGCTIRCKIQEVICVPRAYSNYDLQALTT